jgi:polyketide cyclase/dehydrase/lipid transport protein
MRAYYSAVIPSPASAVWAIARDFGNYRLFTSGKGEAFIEDGKSGDCVGAIRNATLDGRHVRQRLLGHSDQDMFHHYEFCDRAPLAIENYLATLQFRPIVESQSTFVEWTATFDCLTADREDLRQNIEKMFSIWIGSLKTAIEDGAR